MKHFGWIAAALLLAACSGSPIEEGVSRSLAKERAAHIRDVRYHLMFRIPEAKAEPVEGTETLTFTLDGRRDVLLDFREGTESIHSLVVNGKSVPVRWESEHLVLKHLKKGKGHQT